MRVSLTSLIALCLWAASLAGAPVTSGPAEAAQAGDLDALRAMLAADADVDAAQTDGMTALHWAAHRDDAQAVRLLLAAGADVKAQNRYGVTPLSLACVNGDADIVELLIGAGADANETLPGGESALMTAARTGKLDAVKVLLRHGAEVNHAEERSGQTALMWAAAEGHVGVVKELIEFGADIHRRLDTGFTAFFFAVRQGQIGVAEALLTAGEDPNSSFEPAKPVRGGKPRGGESALMLAVSNAHYELAAMLLDAGADPAVDTNGYTVLHRLVSVRRPGIGDNDPPPPGSGSLSDLDFVRKIVAKGADVNARMTKNVNLGNTRLNRLGATPFFLAAHTGDTALMRVLVELGADPAIRNAENSTAVMAAAGLGTRSPGEDPGTEAEIVEALQYLVELGLDVNAVDDLGETAMHSAAYKNLPGAVAFLAANGADIKIWNRENTFGWTPLVIAEGYRYGNFKPSQVTIDALVKVMEAEGVPVVFRGPGGEGISEYK